MNWGSSPVQKFLHQPLVGCDPETMLKGPIPASHKVLGQTGLSVADIDVFEVNEAFASVVMAWEKALQPNPENVNPNGGAIALGHPTGSTGARLITSALHEHERKDGRYGLNRHVLWRGARYRHDHRTPALKAQRICARTLVTL